MKKQIIIIGGGISGLASLHYLNKRFQSDSVDISLLEKNDYAGGTIRSVERNGCMFETGPNGFLNSKPQTFSFLDDLGLSDQLIEANHSAKLRFLQINDQLSLLPTNPKDFIFSNLLNPIEKMRVLGEIFVRTKSSEVETIYDFGKRRFGNAFADTFLDSMVSGIFAGDASKLILKESFPRIYQLEAQYGSLFKAMKALKKLKKKDISPAPKGQLTSFNKGMGQIINRLLQLYKNQIKLKSEVLSISRENNQFVIFTNEKKILANQLILSLPAYASAKIVEGINFPLANDLTKISYAPVAVAGLVYPKEIFRQQPKGFGYLIPSSQKKEVLGVLFESNIFPNRAPESSVSFRIMIGGSRHPNILNKSKDNLIDLAKDEIKKAFQIDRDPQEIFFTAWPNAIPQYNLKYLQLRKSIENQLKAWPNCHIVANYMNGVSFNDCIENAFQSVNKLSL